MKCGAPLVRPLSLIGNDVCTLVLKMNDKVPGLASLAANLPLKPSTDIATRKYPNSEGDTLKVRKVQHFGFSKVDTYEDEVRLVGRYKKLLHLLPRPPTLKTVQQWQLDNKIAGGIYHTSKSLGGESDYLSWFKKNQHVVDHDYANPKWPRDAPRSRSPTLDSVVWESGFGHRPRN